MQALESGSYLKDPPPAEGATPSTPPNPLTDPNAMEGMMDGLKKQAVMMVPQYVVMAWINFFFSRFVLSKYTSAFGMRIGVVDSEVLFSTVRLPFPLTLRFKSMLQRGIETPDLDVSWVSSLSWYFLNLFGLNSVFRLILGDENCMCGQHSRPIFHDSVFCPPSPMQLLMERGTCKRWEALEEPRWGECRGHRLRIL